VSGQNRVPSKALQLNERLGNWIEVAHCTRNIAAALNMQRDYEGAEGYFLKARDHFRRLGSPGQEANCEDLLRLLYTQLGRTAEAEACAARSAALASPG
jgi:tetratricopeptide (TPR) repeat protein